MKILKNFFAQNATSAIPIYPLTQTDFTRWIKNQPGQTRNWTRSNGFTAKPGSVCLAPKTNGQLSQVLIGIKDSSDFWAFGDLTQKLPQGTYAINANWSREKLQLAAIAWGLGGYHFSQYKKGPIVNARLKLAAKVDAQYIMNTVDAIFLIRDMINFPAEYMNPQKLASETQKIAHKFGAKFKQTMGSALKKNYPAVYVVGKSSHNAPRLVELRWGKATDPKVVLVGKGVCFDSGGLNLKPPSSMERMKKDMAGAANALGLAQMIMQSNLPLNLHVILPLVENMVSTYSYKMGDIIKTRKGMTVEITNTDAEGRIILADALTLASEEKPALIIDFATLTGAATVALGTEIPAFFTDNEKIAQKILAAAQKEQDPIWRMPLYKPYRELLDSKIANIKNCAAGGLAGAITAALFLREFVPANIPWVHLDIEAYNPKTKPGRPEGSEASCIRAIFSYLKAEFLRNHSEKQ